MTKDEYKKNIESSDLSTEVKAKILALLAEAGMTDAIIDQIQDLIQADIDKDFAEAGVSLDQNDPEIVQATQTMEKESAALDQAVEDDAKFVETELTDLSGQSKQVEEAVLTAKMDLLKADMMQM